MDTSITDNNNWRSTCEKADIATFRSNKAFIDIVETVPVEWGQKYFDVIKNSDMVSHLSEIQRNDDVGNPLKRLYDKWNISSTTLRYAHILLKLIQLYGNMENWKICEIGIGYGGQCRVINSYCKLSVYCLVDLPEVLSLSKRYLENFDIQNPLLFQDMDTLISDNYDLVISNFAFSEMYHDMQKLYLDKIILKAKHGYMLYNKILTSTCSYRIDDLLKLIPNSRFIPDVLHMPYPDDAITW